MGTVSQRVTNPNALAAIAATGNAESKFSPGNVNRSWSDPSESGQAGNAGGIMSWRAERLQAAQAYARSKGEAGIGSPSTQAEFFLQEDPGLIERLNQAASPEEAADIMAGSWKFAGYDRPGGEAARRRAMARNYFAREYSQGGAPAAAAIDQMAGPAAGVDPMVTNSTGPAPLDMGEFNSRFGAGPDGRVAPQADMDTAIRALSGQQPKPQEAPQAEHYAPQTDSAREFADFASRATQNPSSAQYDELPEWQKPIVAASDILQTTVNGITLGGADNVVAAARAPFTDKTFDEELSEARRQTRGADTGRETPVRLGWHVRRVGSRSRAVTRLCEAV